MALPQHLQADAEAGVGRLGAGDGLEHQVHRRAALDGGDGAGDVGQHAGLGGNPVALDDGVEHLQQVSKRTQAVGGRVDAEHGVAVAVEQAVENAGGDAGRIVGRMVGLQPGRHPPAQAHGVAEAGDHADLLRHQDQVLHTHDLRHRRRHLRGQPRRQGTQRGLAGLLAEQPVAQAADGQVSDRGEGRRVVAVDDQPGDLVVLVGDQRLVEEVPERDVRQRHLRGDPLGVAGGGDAGQLVAGTGRAGLGHDFAQAVETPGLVAYRVGKSGHGWAPRCGRCGRLARRPGVALRAAAPASNRRAPSCAGRRSA